MEDARPGVSSRCEDLTISMFIDVLAARYSLMRYWVAVWVAMRRSALRQAARVLAAASGYAGS